MVEVCKVNSRCVYQLNLMNDEGMPRAEEEEQRN